MNKNCLNCGGPMPERIAPLGRPPSYCSVSCRKDANFARTARRLQEEYRVAMERQAAEAEAARRRNLRAGGTRRLEQLQDDASDVGRCGWFEAGDDHVCQRRVTRVYLAWCREHTEREKKLEEEALEAEMEAFEAEEVPLRDEATPSGAKTD